jgi:integrase/ribosomal protein L40E
MSKKVHEYWINRIKSSGISERNKELLIKLSQDMQDLDLSYARINFYLAKLWVVIYTLDKNLDKLNETEIKNLLRILKNKGYSEWTLYGYKVIIKKFYQWLKGYEWNSKKYPKEVEWIKLSRRINNYKLPEEILIKEEVLRMVENCQNIRDKALIIMLWESGCRINELLNIKLKDIEFDNYGLTMLISGGTEKTQKTISRKLRLVISTPYISKLLKENKKDREDFIFTTKNNNRISEWRVRAIFIDIAKKCDIAKPVNPHAFRHSRATYLARILTEQELKLQMGWTNSSKMASIYVHLSGKDLDDSILKKVYGLMPEEKEEKDTQNICLVCSERNLIEAKYCRSCGSILHITKETLQDMIKEVLNK